MSFIEWSDTLSVGVDMIDADHRGLMELINQLHGEVQDEAGGAFLDEIFERLVAYVEGHFTREEQLLEACSYPELAGHTGEHRRFAEEVRYKRDRYCHGDAEGIGGELLDYLKAWLIHHIMVEDMAYRPFIQDRPEAEAVIKLLERMELPAPV